MLTLDQITEKLKDRNLRAVAAAAGVSYSSLWQIANGTQREPKYSVIKRISDYLETMA